MKKVVGIVIFLCMVISTMSITAEQSETIDTIIMPQPTNRDVTIEIKFNFFDPAVIIIDLPTTVTWVNRDVSPHLVKSNDEIFGSPLLYPGDTYSFTFKTDGIYDYFCAIKPQMTGRIYANFGGNRPPLPPVVYGPTSLEPKITYNFSTTSWDPESMMISYYFDWGDNTNSGWTPFVDSGTEITLSHSWNRRGKYTVRVQAKDIYANATSEWGTLAVTVPVSVDIPFSHFMERLFERFPHIFPVLRYMMGY